MIHFETQTAINQSGVYQIINLINRKIYIGSATCFRTRFNQHVSKLNCNKHHNKTLTNAFKKYGHNNFEFRILELCTKDELYQREQFYIDTLKPYYNHHQRAGIWRGHDRIITKKGGFQKGYKMSEETLLKRKLIFAKRKKEGLINKKPVYSELSKLHRKEKWIITMSQIRNKTTKLDIFKVIQIEKEIAKGKLLKDIGEQFNISGSSISQIKRKIQWASLMNVIF